MKPILYNLKRAHYSSDESDPSFVSSKNLYAEIGYDYDALLMQSTEYQNTCSTRMSLALIKCGIRFYGRLKIKSGPYLGRMIEPGSKLLADQLSLPKLFGPPSVITDTNNISSRLKHKKGVIFFWKILGYGGGHIDIYESHDDGSQICHSHCYFSCKEVWFWSLP